MAGSAITFGVGVVLFVLSGIVGKVMQLAGYGQYPRA